MNNSRRLSRAGFELRRADGIGRLSVNPALEILRIVGDATPTARLKSGADSILEVATTSARRDLRPTGAREERLPDRYHGDSQLRCR